MATMICSKILPIGKPNLPLNKHVPNRSAVARGGSTIKRRGLRMSSAQPAVEVGAEVFLLKGNKVLLGRRRSTAIGHGEFSLPGGHLELGESFEDCAVREVKEETGLDITGVEILTVVTNVAYEPKPTHLISVFLRAALVDPTREPVNVEPEKCDGWGWYDWDHLPSPLITTLESLVLRGINPFPTN